ncbi:MAG: LysR family transcriptional regulator [Lachnospiraceae bacterium]
MELRQLAYFRAIVEAGSISAAARTLHLSQPPLSYQMKTLEEELGTPLFVRGARRITLTPAGEALYARAEGILHLADLAAAEAVRAGQEKTLRLGLAPSTVAGMAGVLRKLQKAEPGLVLQIEDGSSFALRELLAGHALDAAILRGPIPLPGLASKVLFQEKLCAMGTGNLFKGRTVISLEELAACPLILSKRYQSLVEEAFRKAGPIPHIVCTCGDSRTALTLAKAGIGTALLPAQMAEGTGLSCLKVSDADFETDVLLAYDGTDHAPALSLLLSLLAGTKKEASR